MASKTVSMKFKGDLGAQLDEFVGEVQSRAVRAGTFVAAEALRDEMRERAPREEGTLQDSLYVYRDKTRSNDERHIYFIGPNKRKAPHWHLIEYGHWMKYTVIRIRGRLFSLKNRPLKTPKWVPAKPYIRPAFSKVKVALDRGKKRIAEVILEIQRGS